MTFSNLNIGKRGKKVLRFEIFDKLCNFGEKCLMSKGMDFDEFDRYDYVMNDEDERPCRKKLSTQRGGCMLVMMVAVVLCAAMLFWVG